jgi:hypothetical protein
MSDLIISPHDVNGHRSASQRRELALRNEIAIRDAIIAHLKAVIVIALEAREGVPLLVLAARRTQILKEGAAYLVALQENEDVLYSLPAPAEPAPLVEVT